MHLNPPIPRAVEYKNRTSICTIGLREAAALAKCSPDRLREMAKAGWVPGTKIGRCWIFPVHLLEGWLAGRLRMRPRYYAREQIFRNVARRSGLSKRTPEWADLKEIRRIYVECRRISQQTGVKHHVDHIIPLAGRTVSGLHVPGNLQIIPARENQAKLNHHEVE